MSEEGIAKLYPERMLITVASVISAHRPANAGLYMLYIRDKQFYLDRLCDRRDEQHKVRVLSSIDINEGLKSGGWDAIATKIGEYMREEIL